MKRVTVVKSNSGRIYNFIFTWNWIQDLNMRPENIKFLEENIGTNLFHISYTNIFLDISGKGNKGKIIGTIIK